MRVECEAAVVGEQGGEGDQVCPFTVPVLLVDVVGGGEEEGGAAAAQTAEASGGVAAVSAHQAVLSSRGRGFQLMRLAQRE